MRRRQPVNQPAERRSEGMQPFQGDFSEYAEDGNQHRQKVSHPGRGQTQGAEAAQIAPMTPSRHPPNSVGVIECRYVVVDYRQI